jgi:glycosyltransferase involved in cell wall biosynthesis
MPKFSVVITCYNQAAFIEEALQSAMSQPYPDKEIIVVDDCSSDGSQAILRKYETAIRIIASPRNTGASNARNLGAQSAAGEYLVFLDGDDLLLPWALDLYSSVLARCAAPVLLGSLLWFEGHPPKAQPEDFPKQACFVPCQPLIKKDRSNRSTASATVIHRQAFHRIHGWTSGMFPFEDFEILVKLASFPAVQILSPPTTSYRVHSGNSIHNVAPFVQQLCGIIRRIQRSEYPCSRSHRLASYAFLGGPALYWIKRAYSHGLRGDALRLLASGWPMILAAAALRTRTLFTGRRPIEMLPMQWSSSV